ncbi:MAG TPA: TrbC/VirB2 family protein [Actinopolymorphaceae bacterium]
MSIATVGSPAASVAAVTDLHQLAATADKSGGIAGMFDNLSGILTTIAFAALTVAIIIVGFKVMFAIRNGDNIREAVQNMGVVAIAALIIGGASAIASALQAIGKNIAGG